MKAMILATVIVIILMDCPSVSYAEEPQVLMIAEAVSADTASAIAAQASGGRVLSVQSAGGVYLVKVLLENGQVRIVHVDAATGAVVK